MELPALIVNIGAFVAAAAAAAVAWAQANQATSRQRGAEQAEAAARRAKEEAVAAQQSAAKALHEANQIAIGAKELIQANVNLQARRDDRLREYRDVRWLVGWQPDIAHDAPATLRFTNVGTTVACGVSMAVDLPLPISPRRQLFKLGDVDPGECRQVEIEYWEITGPLATAAMTLRDVPFSVHWSSPTGHPSELANTIPAEQPI